MTAPQFPPFTAGTINRQVALVGRKTMEVPMRSRFTIALGVCALAFGWTTAANAEYFNRYTAGSWTDAVYNDGVCQYYYAFNSQTGETHINRYGNCTNVAIGPDGRPVPVVPMAQWVPSYR